MYIITQQQVKILNLTQTVNYPMRKPYFRQQPAQSHSGSDLGNGKQWIMDGYLFDDTVSSAQNNDAECAGGAMLNRRG